MGRRWSAGWLEESRCGGGGSSGSLTKGRVCRNQEASRKCSKRCRTRSLVGWNGSVNTRLVAWGRCYKMDRYQSGTNLSSSGSCWVMNSGMSGVRLVLCRRAGGVYSFLRGDWWNAAIENVIDWYGFIQFVGCILFGGRSQIPRRFMSSLVLGWA